MEFLDTTIRDGSYAINFNYSCEDVLEIVKLLKRSRIKYIEVGNGISVGMKNNNSLFSDYDYFEYIYDEINGEINFGTLYIPGISDNSILEFCKKIGLKFIRIGEVSNEINGIFKDIQKIRHMGFQEIFLQVVKTNLITPGKMGEIAKNAEKCGVNVIYIVDSNGTMTPHEILDYLYEIRSSSTIKVGYHGHNNCGCALLNSYQFLCAGGDFLDVTLAGIGRGPGNTRFEDVLHLLKKEGIKIDIDINAIWEGAKLIENIMNKSLDVDFRVMSYHNFDSNYYNWMVSFLNNYQINFAESVSKIASKSNYVYTEKELKKFLQDLYKLPK